MTDVEQGEATLRPRTNGAVAPFHLAFPVNNLEATRDFYVRVLGCDEGRSSDCWIDFNLFGHQVVAHLVGSDRVQPGSVGGNAVDGQHVPVPHFGVVLSWDDFEAFARRIADAGIECEIGPYVRFEGQPGEQATMFFRDPSGNALEFKAFRDPSNLFAR